MDEMVPKCVKLLQLLREIDNNARNKKKYFHHDFNNKTKYDSKCIALILLLKTASRLIEDRLKTTRRLIEDRLKTP